MEYSRLEKDLRISKKAAYTEGTCKNHLTQWRCYLIFCSYFKLKACPASVHTICLYAQFLSRTHKPQSVKNYISGVKLLHLIAGHESPFKESFELRLTLKGITRLAQHTPTRAPPITPEILVKLVSVCDLSNSLEITFLCAFLFTFFLFARASNIVPLSASKFNNATHLCRGDIFITRLGLLVLFKWTKTIQCQERRLFLPLVSIDNSPICPVQMFHRMCSLTSAPKSAPAFLYKVSKHKFISVNKSQFVTFLRAKLEIAGVTHPRLYRGHSFRRGAASFAFSCGVPGELIQVFGDWASDAYLQYLDISLESKLRVAFDMRSRILCL